MGPDVFRFPKRKGRQECEGRMPELPGEPRLQLSEGCRACGRGAIRQKNFLGGGFHRYGQVPVSLVRGLRSWLLPVPIPVVLPLDPPTDIARRALLA